ncbi:hypothetical protein [Microcoleus sp. D3_18a_C4]|uniref:hypothetical protein n=1 Tax=unclassified Microcoleus TaxID=2642155 RepID=UPI002FD59927
MNFYQFSQYWQQVVDRAAGPFYATTQISGRKYRYKTVSRHQLLTHQLPAFEKVRETDLSRTREAGPLR